MLRALRFIALDFGPLVAFWIADALAGLKVAIAVSIVVALADAAYKLVRKQKFGQMFVFSLAMTLLFGSIDLMLKDPIFLKYEATITNLATAVFFGVAAFGRKPLILEFAEKSGRLSGNRPPDLVPFFRVLTLVWAGYFVAKAALYLYFALHFTFEQAMARRAVIGPVSFYALLAASMFGGRFIYGLMRWSGALSIAVRLFPKDAASNTAPVL